MDYVWEGKDLVSYIYLASGKETTQLGEVKLKSNFCKIQCF